MQRTVIDHPRLKVRVKTGSEGPRHDPYGYTEIDVETNGNEILFHEGLGTWMKVNDVEVNPPKHLTYEEGEKWLRETAFPQLTGYTRQQLERLDQKLRSRCRKCGGREFHSESGYPGEHFEVCTKCGSVVDSYFCESEVI